MKRRTYDIGAEYSLPSGVHLNSARSKQAGEKFKPLLFVGGWWITISRDDGARFLKHNRKNHVI